MSRMTLRTYIAIRVITKQSKTRFRNLSGNLSLKMSYYELQRYTGIPKRPRINKIANSILYTLTPNFFQFSWALQGSRIILLGPGTPNLSHWSPWGGAESLHKPQTIWKPLLALQSKFLCYGPRAKSPHLPAIDILIPLSSAQTCSYKVGEAREHWHVEFIWVRKNHTRKQIVLAILTP